MLSYYVLLVLFNQMVVYASQNKKNEQQFLFLVYLRTEIKSHLHVKRWHSTDHFFANIQVWFHHHHLIIFILVNSNIYKKDLP